MESEFLQKITFTPEIGQDIANILQDSAVQKAYARRNEYQLLDSADYYFSHIERISSPEYIPTEQDVLRCRVKTTGIVESEFDFGGFHFRMFDVGGQRNESKSARSGSISI